MPLPAEGGGALPGFYFDGRSAARQPARIRLAPPLLLVASPEGMALADWPLSQTRLIDREGSEARLGRGDERLVLDASAAAPILAALPGFQPRSRGWRRVAVLGAGAAILAGSLLLGGARIADGVAMLVPDRAAAAIGDMALRQATAGARLCNAPAGQAALEGLTARLAGAAGMAAPPAVAVVDRREVNAFAVPGNRMVLLRGLVERAEDAEEVAGVLAHEIGHLHRNHPLRGLVRAVGLGVLASVLTGGSDLAGLGATLLTLANSRAFEAEADAEAARILGTAGIGTAGLRRFFARMDGSGLPEAARYITTHPPSAERGAALPDRAGTRPALSAGEWQALRRIC